MKKLCGVVPPVVTPMHENGEIDYESLQSLCEFLINAGVDGLYPNGSTGEMGFLTIEEREKVAETVVKTANHRVTVFVMVGTNNVQDTIRLARHAQKIGADGIGVVTPYYYKLDDTELFDYFVEIASSVPKDFPIYLYGIPQCAVNDISISLAEKVADKCPNVIGIKYSYPDMDKIHKFGNIRNGDFSVICGPDNFFYLTLCDGGDGTISGNANCIPELFIAVRDAFTAGDYKKAERLQRKVNKLIPIISGPNNNARYKAVLKRRGIIKTDMMRKPFRPITDDEKNDLFEKIDALEYLKTE